jgi:hypothetical protein
LKLTLLYLWIRQNLKIDTKINSTWRQLTQLSDYKQVIDSVEDSLSGLLFIPFHKLNLISSNTEQIVLKINMESKGIEIISTPVTFYNEVNCHKDDEYDIRLVDDVTITLYGGTSPSHGDVFYRAVCVENKSNCTAKVTLHILPECDNRENLKWEIFTVIIEPTCQEEANTYYLELDESDIKLHIISIIQKQQN